MLYRDTDGSMADLKNHSSKLVFHPPSASNARDQIKGKDDKMLHLNPFGYSKYLELDENHQKKAKVLYGDFVPASGNPLRGQVNRNRNNRTQA